MRLALRILIVVLATFASRPAAAYSVLAHEAVVDALWEPALAPMIKARFPNATAETVARARAYAYGGCLIQDAGYYPFGSRFFSNLLHYVRSGDFVAALVRESRSPEEYAFALGAAAHHVGDNTGHPIAVNRAVPIVFPKLRAQFGDHVTYVHGRTQHIVVEFSFDVAQVVAGRYLQEALRSMVEFQVATPLLERAFHDTYGLEMRDVVADTDLAIGSYRYAVSQIVPAITLAAWRDRHEELAKTSPTIREGDVVLVYGRSDYERTFGLRYRKPGLFARFLAVLYRIVPKVGPLAPLSYKAPTADVEALFRESLARTRDRYRDALRDILSGKALPNTDFDTGAPCAYGEYPLADETYGKLLGRLERTPSVRPPAALLQHLTAFYAHGPGTSASGKAGKRWRRAKERLSRLQALASSESSSERTMDGGGVPRD
jgi:Zinc dependent phospholipase C